MTWMLRYYWMIMRWRALYGNWWAWVALVNVKMVTSAPLKNSANSMMARDFVRCAERKGSWHEISHGCPPRCSCVPLQLMYYCFSRERVLKSIFYSPKNIITCTWLHQRYVHVKEEYLNFWEGQKNSTMIKGLKNNLIVFLSNLNLSS